jgi:predicted GNAT family acetyltransferase
VIGTAALRVLDAHDLGRVEDLLARDPIVNVFVASRVRCGPDPWRMGGELWGWTVDGRLEALCFAGANLVPVEAGPEAIQAFADRARRQGRRCSSIVGPTEMVEPLWHLLEPAWGPARTVRSRQPFMAIDEDPRVEPDPLVRRVLPEELDLLYPASVAMFTEEVGISPVQGDPQAYRTRVGELIESGRAFARIEDGRVLFKAEVGAVTDQACQIQGVWVDPGERGRGLSGPGTAAVVAAARRDFAPVVTLYVNDFNTAARRAYAHVGFHDLATFSSVLF